MMRIQYAVAYVSNMSRSVAFYRDIVGIPLKFESPGWSEFATEGATLALHLCEKETDNDATATAGQWRSGFQVEDLEAFHERMLTNQVNCLEEPKETFGVRIAQYQDPDGLVFSVSQARTD